MEETDRLLWVHTSSVLAVLINANRDPNKSKPVEPHQLNPHMQGQKRPRKTVDKEDLALLRDVFTRKKA